jgi:MoxR-like ATPase
VQRLVHFSRHEQEFCIRSVTARRVGIAAKRAWALLHRRSHVVPEDVQAVLPSVVEHRLRSAADFSGHGGGALAQKLLSGVDVVG